MKSEPEAIAGTHTDPLKPPPKRVEEASEMELFDAIKAIFAGEEPNLIFEDPRAKGDVQSRVRDDAAGSEPAGVPGVEPDGRAG